MFSFARNFLSLGTAFGCASQIWNYFKGNQRLNREDKLTTKYAIMVAEKDGQIHKAQKDNDELMKQNQELNKNNQELKESAKEKSNQIEKLKTKVKEQELALNKRESK